MRYTAWGAVRYENSTTPTDYTYTGQFSYSADFGLMFYNARWYDAALGRFAQADSVIPGAGDSQAWDRYAYSLNNPVKYVDPTGHYVCEDLECLGPPRNLHKKVLIGISPSMSSTGTFYGEQAEESTCFNCSMEPELPPGTSALAGLPGLLNDILAGGKNYLAVYGQDIPVFANITNNADGSVSVLSLTIDNTNTGATISVMQVTFSVSGDNMQCNSPSGCLKSAPYGYQVQPEYGYYAPDIKAPGIGILTQPNSTQNVSLVPSGYPNNPTNTFHREFTITVYLGNSQTGDIYKPISLTINP